MATFRILVSLRTRSRTCERFRSRRKQIHDANIAATMLAHGERRLLTLNVKDFRRYGERIELVDLEEAV